MRRSDDLDSGAFRPLRRGEYDRLVELGAFADERIELLYGRLVPMSPQGPRHVYAVRRLAELLMAVLRGRAQVHVQAPVAASDVSEPEPDVVIVPPGDYLDDHPDHAHLVVEVADSSLARDRTVKSRLYAEWGAAEYWLVDIAVGVVDVYREPSSTGYRKVTRRHRRDAIALLAFPDVTLRVADFMPPARRRRTRTSKR